MDRCAAETLKHVQCKRLAICSSVFCSQHEKLMTARTRNGEANRYREKCLPCNTDFVRTIQDIIQTPVNPDDIIHTGGLNNSHDFLIHGKKIEFKHNAIKLNDIPQLSQVWTTKY